MKGHRFVLFALKVDVHTLRGTRDGVARLIDVLQRHGARATFYFTLGPDHRGHRCGPRRSAVAQGISCVTSVTRGSRPAFRLSTVVAGSIGSSRRRRNGSKRDAARHLGVRRRVWRAPCDARCAGMADDRALAAAHATPGIRIRVRRARPLSASAGLERRADPAAPVSHDAPDARRARRARRRQRSERRRPSSGAHQRRKSGAGVSRCRRNGRVPSSPRCSSSSSWGGAPRVTNWRGFAISTRRWSRWRSRASRSAGATSRDARTSFLVQQQLFLADDRVRAA